MKPKDTFVAVFPNLYALEDEDGGPKITVCITSKAFWKKEECQDDSDDYGWGIENLLEANHCEHLSECTYGYDGNLTAAALLKRLKAEGFAYSKAFQEFCEN